MPADPCPDREALRRYARGERNPRLAGHISRCDPCAWFVTDAMETEPLAGSGEFIDITPSRPWFRPLLDWLASLLHRRR
jgi:hypothetical protein